MFPVQVNFLMPTRLLIEFIHIYDKEKLGAYGVKLHFEKSLYQNLLWI
jgi:hypothetical protein